MITKAFAKRLMECNENVRPTECTILAHCQTRVFEFPKTHISTAHPLRPATIIKRQGAHATVVSDLTDYFENRTPFQNYKNCRELRSKVEEAIVENTANSMPDRFPLFVVIERETQCKTQLETGTCYIVDQGFLAGGLKGRDGVVAFKAIDAPWPELDENDTGFANLVLATIKILQGEINVIREIVGSSCFLDDLHRSVHPIILSFGGNLSMSSPITEMELTNKLRELRKLAGAFEREQRKNREGIEVLVDALRLESIETNHYRCAWYLSLFEATKAILSGNARHKFYQRHCNYRKLIGHPKPNTKMDMDQFNEMQSDAIDQLKKIFLDT